MLIRLTNSLLHTRRQTTTQVQTHTTSRTRQIGPNRRSLHTFHFFARSPARLRFITDLICNFFRISMFLMMWTEWVEPLPMLIRRCETCWMPCVPCASHITRSPHESDTGSKWHSTHSSEPEPIQVDRISSIYFSLCTIAIDSKRVKLTNCIF